MAHNEILMMGVLGFPSSSWLIVLLSHPKNVKPKTNPKTNKPTMNILLFIKYFLMIFLYSP